MVEPILMWYNIGSLPSLQDFDLCLTCYKEVSHPHHMDKLGLGLELDQSLNQASQKDPKEQRKASIEKCIRFLVHATQCHNASCKQPSCIKMKRVLTHTRECKLMLSGKWNQCTVCKQFVLLCISHAKSCTTDRCPVPVCARIKKNLRDQRNQRRIQENRFMHQRMAQMNSALNNNTPPTSQASSVASPAPPNNTSPGNPTSISSPSKAKGSPATHPSNPASNKPYMSAPSPTTGPHSVGKGGPRTPNMVPPVTKASMMVNSPAMHGGHLSPAPPPPPPMPSAAGKPEAVQVSVLPEQLPEELTIHKMMGPMPRDQPMVSMRPAAQQQQQQQRMNPMMNRQMQGMVGHPGAMNHMGGAIYANPQVPSRVQPHMAGGNFHQMGGPQHNVMMRQYRRVMPQGK